VGVDGPGGRPALGLWSLTESLRAEPVDLPSSLPAEELSRRLDAHPRDRWALFGRGVTVWRVRSWYRLTLRGRPRVSPRPRAYVRVVPDGDGARLRGVVGPTRLECVVQVVLMAFAALMSVLLAFSAGYAFTVVGLLVLTVNLVLNERRAETQRGQLRAYLAELVA